VEEDVVRAVQNALVDSGKQVQLLRRHRRKLLFGLRARSLELVVQLKAAV
jgi:hypothetical protein